MRFGLVVGLVCAVCALCGCAAELVHDLDENSANDTVAVLHENGIAADKVQRGRGGWTVTVPRDQRSQAWNVVRDSGLADVPDTAAGDLMPSPAARRAGLAGAAARRLEGSLEMLTGVVDARVHLTLPPTQRVRIPGAQRPSPRASVLLRVRGDQPHAAAQSKALVVGAVDEMRAEDVQVVLVQAPATPALAAEVVPMGPWAVTAASAGPLRALLGGLLAAVAVLALATVVLVVRLRRRGIGP